MKTDNQILMEFLAIAKSTLGYIDSKNATNKQNKSLVMKIKFSIITQHNKKVKCQSQNQ